MKYHKVAVGGTFDHFHAGHQQLLNTALSLAHNLVVGITQPQLTSTKILHSLIEPLSVRKASLRHYLNQYPDVATRIVELSDHFGPTLYDKGIDALVVSQQTVSGATRLNQLRHQHQLPPLPVIVSPMICDESGEYISSTRIRQGLINRQGKVYKKLFEQNILFSSTQLHQLQSPQGRIIDLDAIPSAPKTILVGDIITQQFLRSQLKFDYAIVDGKSRRRHLRINYPSQIKLHFTNPPGQISSRVANEIIAHAAKIPCQTILRVSGEEDLLAFVPALTESLESLILYGQPEGGIVMILLSETEKERLAHIIKPQF